MTKLAKETKAEIEDNPQNRDDIICSKFKSDYEIETYLRSRGKWSRYKNFSDILAPAYALLVDEIVKSCLYKPCKNIVDDLTCKSIKELKEAIIHLEDMDLCSEYSFPYRLNEFIKNDDKSELVNVCKEVIYKKPKKTRRKKQSIVEQWMNGGF